MTVDKLEGQPFAQAESHPGDLLVALLETDATFWATQPELWQRAMLVLNEAAEQVARTQEQEELSDYMPEYVGEDFMAAVLHFKDIHARKAATES